MIKYTIPLLRKSKSPVIINLSSEQVKKVKKKSAPYAVSKAAIESLTKIAALELLEDKIRVNAIELASVNTNFIREYIGDDKKMEKMIKSADKEMPYGIINVNDVWKIVSYLIEDDNKVTGQIILIDSGTTI